ncbi:D-alanyl-D-alanine carboxypeptidase/D-alanyl-D-alanine endopeptidase [Ruicaihuangia caeni]|uniref:D-alanyl-D-alanine carboxypeptidase/D-alanyl-D-alanine endopeptidase n=1 Tax=Ruicaihuangia caeni TaxID=3042517 RepID=UPI00338E20B5
MTDEQPPLSRRERRDAERAQEHDDRARAAEPATEAMPMVPEEGADAGDQGSGVHDEPTAAYSVVDEPTAAYSVVDEPTAAIDRSELPDFDGDAGREPAASEVAPGGDERRAPGSAHDDVPTVLIGAPAGLASESAAGYAAAAAAGDQLAPATAPGGGLSGLFRRHPRAWLTAALATAFALLGAGSVVAGVAVGASGSTQAAPEPPPVVVPTETEEPPRPLPDPLTTPSALRTCSITPQTQTAALGALYASVLDANTGEVLFDRNAAAPERPASVLKVLTAAAALDVLGPDHRLTTRVVQGDDPDTIVLVGGGDATLSRLGSGSESFYPGAPKLGDLAAQVRAKLTDEVDEVTLVLDSTLWDPNDSWESSWDRSEQTQGYMSEVTALQVDGDRDDPTRGTSRRSDDPVARAGEWFTSALQAEGVRVDSVKLGAAPANAAVLAEVQSQPVATLVRQMLLVSDNTIAEMLARVTSKRLGLAGTFGSLQETYSRALSNYGIPTTGMTIRDGSGLSEHNRATPVYVSQLLAKALHGERNLRVLYDGLPVAGKTGSLASRYTGDNAVARGAIAAKTGWIWTGRSLAGVVNAADGTQLAFAFYAVGDDDVVTTTALDTLATAVYRCGANLSNQ